MEKIPVSKSVLEKLIAARMVHFLDVDTVSKLFNILYPEAKAEGCFVIDKEDGEKLCQIMLRPEVMFTVTTDLDRYHVLKEL